MSIIETPKVLEYSDLPDDVRYYIFTFVGDYMKLSTSIIGKIFNPTRYSILNEPFNPAIWSNSSNELSIIYIDKCIYTILYYIFKGKFHMIKESVYKFVHKNHKAVIDLLQQRFPPVIDMYNSEAIEGIYELRIPEEMLSIYMFKEIIELSFYATSVVDEMLHIDFQNNMKYHQSVGFVGNVFVYSSDNIKTIPNKEYYNMSELIKYALLNPNVLVPDNYSLVINGIDLNGYYYQLVYYVYVFLLNASDSILHYLLNNIRYDPDRFIELSITQFSVFINKSGEYIYRFRLIKFINKVLYINYDYYDSLKQIIKIFNAISSDRTISYIDYTDLFTLSRMYSILTDINHYQDLDKLAIDEFVKCISYTYDVFEVDEFQERMSEFTKANIEKRGYYDDHSLLCSQMYIFAEKIVTLL